MQVNNTNNQSFGMKMQMGAAIRLLSEREQYALYKINQTLAPIKGPDLNCFFMSDISAKKNGVSMTSLHGKTGNGKAYIQNTVRHDCPDFNITHNDLNALVEKIQQKRSKVAKWLDRFMLESKSPEPSEFGLRYTKEELEGMENWLS